MFAKSRLAPFLALMLLLVACVGNDAEDPTPTPAQTAPTSTPVPQAQLPTQTAPDNPSLPSATAAPQATPQPVATQSPAATPTPDPLAELDAAIRAASSIRSFKAEIIIEEPGQARQTGSISYVQPDRMLMTFINSGQQIELIVIGTDAYIKFAGSWSKLPAGTSNQPFDFSEFNSWLNAFGSSIGAVKGGTDAAAGKTCQIYTVTSTQTRDTVEYCIADNRFVRVVARSGGSATTLVFTEYNANLDIRAPI